MMRRRNHPRTGLGLLLSGLLVAGLLAGCGGSDEGNEAQPSASASPTSLEKVRLALPFAPNGLITGLVAGVRRGMFTEHGVDVELLPPLANPSEVQRLLAAGSAEIGMPSSLESIIARSRGLPLVSIGSLLQGGGSGILTGVNNGIDLQNLKTLEGRTVGITGQPSAKALLQDALTKQGVDISKIKWVTVGFNGIPMLAQKKIDAHGDTVVFRPPAYNAALKKPLDDTTTYQFRQYTDFGSIPFSLTGFSATEKYLAAHGDTATKFLAGMQDSLEWASANPDEAAKELVAQYPDLDQASIAAQWKAVIPLVHNADTDKHGLTWQNPDAYNRMAAFLAEKGIAAKVVTADEGMTNEYVPEK